MPHPPWISMLDQGTLYFGILFCFLYKTILVNFVLKTLYNGSESQMLGQEAYSVGTLHWGYLLLRKLASSGTQIYISTAADVSPRSRCFLRHKDMGQADIFHMSHGDLHPFHTVYEGFIRCPMLQHHPIRNSPHVCPDQIKKLVNRYIGFGSAPVIKGHWERNVVGNLWSKRRTRNDGRDDSDQINAIFLGEFPSCLLS